MTPRPPKQRSISDWIRLGFLINEFWTGRESSIWEVWAAPAAPKTTPDGGGVAPHLLEWFLGPPGPPKPQNSTISGRPKNHILKNKCDLCWCIPGSKGPSRPDGGGTCMRARTVSQHIRVGAPAVWTRGRRSPCDGPFPNERALNP
jgi:hypothetical protein